MPSLLHLFRSRRSDHNESLSIFFLKSWKFYFLILPGFICLSSGIHAQDAAPAGGGGGAELWRVGFYEIIQTTYTSDLDHPFYIMTGTERFNGGKGFFGITTLDLGGGDIIPNVGLKDADGHSGEDGTLTALFSNIPFLKGLPTFSVEYIIPTEYMVGVGFEFSHTNTWLNDLTARKATTSADPIYATPLIRMANHFYMFSASLHPLGVPAADDLDVFLGIGFARVESTIKYGIRGNPSIADYAPTTVTKVTGTTGSLTYQRMGIATGGESFGFMLEFFMMNDNEVLDNPFASDTIIDATIYDSTYNDRGTALPAKVGLKGGITRASWIYSFK